MGNKLTVKGWERSSRWGSSGCTPSSLKGTTDSHADAPFTDRSIPASSGSRSPRPQGGMWVRGQGLGPSSHGPQAGPPTLHLARCQDRPQSSGAVPHGELISDTMPFEDEGFLIYQPIRHRLSRPGSRPPCPLRLGPLEKHVCRERSDNSDPTESYVLVILSRLSVAPSPPLWDSIDR
jgi:hypothetical protein